MAINTNIQPQLHTPTPIHRKTGQPLPIGIARHREIRDIPLQHLRKRCNQRRYRAHICRLPIPERIPDIKAMQRRWHLKLIRIREIPQCARQLVRVAREDALRGQEDSTVQPVGVRHAPVIHSWIQRLNDILHNLRRDARVTRHEIRLKLRVGADAGVREQHAFIRVMARHDLDVVGEGASRQ